MKVCSICEENKSFDEYYSYEKESKTKGKYLYYQPYCKDCSRKKSLISHFEHKEINNQRSKEWYANHKEEVLAEKKIYILDKKEQYAAVQKEWRENNKNKTKEYNLKYKQKQFKLSTKEWDMCKKYFNNCCAYCGINEQEAKLKYNKGLNKEHAINEGNNDLSNCLPACTGCNSTKNKEDYTTWYTPDNPIYNDVRLKLIQNWLTGDFNKYIKITI